MQTTEYVFILIYKINYNKFPANNQESIILISLEYVTVNFLQIYKELITF